MRKAGGTPGTLPALCGYVAGWAGKYKGRLYLGSVCSFFSSLSTAIPTMAAAFALDKAIQAYWTNTAIDTVLIWQTLWIIIGSIVLNFLLSYLRAVLQESIGYEVAAGQRIHLGDVLKRVPLGYFSQNSVGDILAGPWVLFAEQCR